MLTTDKGNEMISVLIQALNDLAIAREGDNNDDHIAAAENALSIALFVLVEREVEGHVVPLAATGLSEARKRALV